MVLFRVFTWFYFVCLHGFTSYVHMVLLRVFTWFYFVCLHGFISYVYMVLFRVFTWFYLFIYRYFCVLELPDSENPRGDPGDPHQWIEETRVQRIRFSRYVDLVFRPWHWSSTRDLELWIFGIRIWWQEMISCPRIHCLVKQHFIATKLHLLTFLYVCSGGSSISQKVALTPKTGCQLIIYRLSPPQNCMKIKEIGPRLGDLSEAPGSANNLWAVWGIPLS